MKVSVSESGEDVAYHLREDLCVLLSPIFVLFRTRFYAATSLIRENPCNSWLKNEQVTCCPRCHTSQNQEPRITRVFTDETAPHTVSFLTRKLHRHLPLYACCDFAFFLCSSGYFSYYYVQCLCVSAHVLCRHFLFREVPCVPWFGKGGMDTAFVTTEHTELHGKDRNRVRVNRVAGEACSVLL